MFGHQRHRTSDREHPLQEHERSRRAALAYMERLVRDRKEGLELNRTLLTHAAGARQTKHGVSPTMV